MESSRDYIARDNPRAAAGMVDRIVGAAEALRLQPEMGRRGRVAGTREFVVSPFVIAYRAAADAVEIVAVIHAARRWPDTL